MGTVPCLYSAFSSVLLSSLCLSRPSFLVSCLLHPSPPLSASLLPSVSDEGAKDVAKWEAALQDELAQLTLEGEGQGEGSGGVPEDTEAWEKEIAELLEPTT